MRKFRFLIQWFVILLLSFNVQACSSVQQLIQGTPTFTPTLSPTYTPTLTFTPTRTPTPTNTPTPNPTATEFANRSNLMQLEIQNYVDQGYLSTSTGTYDELPDFKEDWAKLNWYQWWLTDFWGSNFVVSAHFSWKTANDSTYTSGCGLALGYQYTTPEVFILHRSKVVVLDSSGRDSKILEGNGRVDISSPMEANFTLIVDGSEKTAYVLVDDQFVGKYPLERLGTFNVGYTILSGTSLDFGTHCEISKVRVWKIK